MPGIVIDVSAMLVASMHFRVLAGVGWKIIDCCAWGRAAYKAQTVT